MSRSIVVTNFVSVRFMSLIPLISSSVIGSNCCKTSLNCIGVTIQVAKLMQIDDKAKKIQLEIDFRRLTAIFGPNKRIKMRIKPGKIGQKTEKGAYFRSDGTSPLLWTYSPSTRSFAILEDFLQHTLHQ